MRTEAISLLCVHFIQGTGTRRRASDLVSVVRLTFLLEFVYGQTTWRGELHAEGPRVDVSGIGALSAGDDTTLQTIFHHTIYFSSPCTMSTRFSMWSGELNAGDKKYNFSFKICKDSFTKQKDHLMCHMGSIVNSLNVTQRWTSYKLQCVRTL